MRTALVCSVFLIAISACSGDDLLLPDGAPAQIRAVSGDGQSARAGDPLVHPLVVEVLDRAARPIPGAAVSFEFIDQARGAEISAPTTATGADGRASAQVTLGNTVGDQPVVARLAEAGADLHVQFLLTALQRNDGGATGGGGDGGGGDGGGGDGGGGDDGGGDDGGGDDGGDGGQRGGDDHSGKGKGKDKHDH